MPLARFFDFCSLVASQLLTLFGCLRFTSLDELANQRRPARFMRWSERKRRVNQFNGGFLIDGKVRRLSQRVSFQSLLTVGGMGTGKSANLVLPNILTADNCSLVLSDTSGEIFEQTSGYLESAGYAIRVLDLMNPAQSSRYNPLVRVGGYSAADQAAHIIMNAAKTGGTADPIWAEGAQRLVRILIRTLKNSETDQPATLMDVLYWLNHFDAHCKDSALNKFIVEHTINDTATYQDYLGFTKAVPEKMLLSFVATATTALKAVANPDMHGLLGGDDFDFAELRERKTAVFVKVHQQHMGQFRFLLSLFYTELCHSLLHERRDGLPVYLLLDEFGHLKIPEFDIFATTARKYRVGFWLFVQSLAQLEERYGQHGARTILGGLGTEIYFGGMDFALASDISNRLGTAFKLNLLDPQAGLQQGQLMRPDEVIRLKDNQMLVLHSNRDPMRINTLPFYARGDLRRRAKQPAATEQ